MENSDRSETAGEAVDFLMRVHYGFFMANPRFWYDKLLQESDKIVCKLASEIRLGNRTVDNLL